MWVSWVRWHVKNKIEQMYGLVKGEQFMHEYLLKFILDDVRKTVENQPT